MQNAKFATQKILHSAFILLTLIYRGGQIRTDDFCVPNAALYQAELRPVIRAKINQLFWRAYSLTQLDVACIGSTLNDSNAMRFNILRLQKFNRCINFISGQHNYQSNSHIESGEHFALGDLGALLN